MNQKNEKKDEVIPRARSFREAMRLASELVRQDIETMTKEELAEELTTYEPGVPHYWFGRPVEPITKEELLAYWNGGPEPEIHYKDETPEPKAGREKAGVY